MKNNDSKIFIGGGTTVLSKNTQRKEGKRQVERKLSRYFPLNLQLHAAVNNPYTFNITGDVAVSAEIKERENYYKFTIGKYASGVDGQYGFFKVGAKRYGDIQPNTYNNVIIESLFLGYFNNMPNTIIFLEFNAEIGKNEITVIFNNKLKVSLASNDEMTFYVGDFSSSYPNEKELILFFQNNNGKTVPVEIK